MTHETASNTQCRICAIGQNRGQHEFIDAPWLASDGFVAFTSIGAMLRGWSLVAPAAHSTNLTTNYQDPKFLRFLRDAVCVVESAYGPCVIFEHGSTRPGSLTGCGTEHAHLHIVPLEADLVSLARAFDSSLSWSPCEMKGISQAAQGAEYLFVANAFDGDRTSGAIALLEEGRSQFFRRVISSHLNRFSEFDYKDHPQWDVARESAIELANRVSIDQKVAA